MEAGQEALSLNIEADWAGCVEELSLTACLAGGENCQEEEGSCDQLTVQANVSRLVLGGRTANTTYGVAVRVRYHDNSTQTISHQCVTTKVIDIFQTLSQFFIIF